MVDVESRQRARSIVQRRGLGGLVNDTKWAEFFARIVAARVPLEIKLIDIDEVFGCGAVWSPVAGYVEGAGNMGPVLYVFIEWVRSSAIEQVASAARSAGLECDMGAEAATVYGYR